MEEKKWVVIGNASDKQTNITKRPSSVIIYYLFVWKVFDFNVICENIGIKIYMSILLLSMNPRETLKYHT